MTMKPFFLFAAMLSLPIASLLALDATGTPGDDRLDLVHPWRAMSTAPLSLGRHEGRDELVVFRSSTEGPGTTAVWNGTAWRLPADGPALATGVAVAYDPVRAELVAFGGAPVSDETWVYDGQGRWQRRLPAHCPPGRAGAGLAWLPGKGRLVLVGGADAAARNDTWSWDGSDWREETPVTPIQAMPKVSLGYDAASARLVAYGRGVDFFAGNMTWTYDGTTWAKVGSAHTAEGSMFALDGGLLIATPGATGVNAGVWRWSGSAWASQNWLGWAGAAVGPCLADAQHHRVMVVEPGAVVKAYTNGAVPAWQTQSAPFLPFNQNGKSWLAGQADVNGDGHEELLCFGSGPLAPGSSSSAWGVAAYGVGPAGAETEPRWIGRWTNTPTSSPVALTTGDLDGDGRPDLIVACKDGLRVFANGTQGLGTQPAWTANLVGIDGLVCRDQDGDGRPDLLVLVTERSGTSNYNGTARVLSFPNLAGHLAGTPTELYRSATRQDLYGRTLAVRRDPIAGLVVAIGYTINNEGVVEVLAGTAADNGLMLRRTISDVALPLIFTDIDGDGRDDLVCFNRVFTGLADGTFSETSAWSPEPSPGQMTGQGSWIQARDVDGDGDLDLACSLGGQNGKRNCLLYRNAGGQLGPTPFWSAASDPEVFGETYVPVNVLLDVDGNGWCDWFGNIGVHLLGAMVPDTVAPLAPTDVVLRTRGPAHTSLDLSWGHGEAADVANWIIWADDPSHIIATLPAATRAYVVTGLAKGWHSVGVRAVDRAGNISTSSSAHVTVSGQVNAAGDQYPDLGWSLKVRAVADCDKDGDPDLLVQGMYFDGNSANAGMTGTSWIEYERNDGQGAFTPVWRRSLPGGLMAVHLHDIDHDGLPDLLLSTNDAVSGWKLEAFRNIGGDFAATSAWSLTSTLAQSWETPDLQPLDFADCDGDGHEDLYWQGRIWKGEAGGIFAGAVLWDAGSFLTTHAITDFADYDGDGRADMITLGVTKSAITAAWWRMGATGQPVISSPAQTFALSKKWSGANLNYSRASADVADFNADGRADLTVFASDLNNSAVFLLQADGHGLVLVGQHASRDYHNGAGKGIGVPTMWRDADGDGKLDLVGGSAVWLARSGNGTSPIGAADSWWYGDNDQNGLGKIFPFVDSPWVHDVPSIIEVADLGGAHSCDFIIEDDFVGRFNGMILRRNGGLPAMVEAKLLQAYYAKPSLVVLHAIGETATITFGAFDWNEQPVDLSSGIRLVSSAPDVVEVAGDKVIARRSGISTITVSSAASQNGLSSITVQVILPPAQPVGISLLPERLSLSGPGDQVGLSTLLRFDDGSERHIESQTTFTSSAPGVIAITSPWAVAKAGGTSTITAHYGGMSSQVVMQVGSAPSPTSLSIRLGKVSMIPGGSTGFEVVATWADGHQTSVTDLVSVDTTNHAIATVSGSTLYGVLAGQTNLVVNWLGMTTSAAVVVTAAPLAQLSRTDAIIANHGDDQVLGSHIGQAIPLDYLMRAGGTELHLGAFTASGLVGCTVAITQPLAVVPPGQAGSLRVAITPLANAWSCSISGITNDPLRNPYQWTIGGMAAPVPGNLDGSLDGKVTFEDLALFLSSYGKVTTDAGYLIGADLVTSGSSAGRVDFDDLSAFLALYATAP